MADGMWTEPSVLDTPKLASQAGGGDELLVDPHTPIGVNSCVRSRVAVPDEVKQILVRFRLKIHRCRHSAVAARSRQRPPYRSMQRTPFRSADAHPLSGRPPAQRTHFRFAAGSRYPFSSVATQKAKPLSFL